MNQSQPQTQSPHHADDSYIATVSNAGRVSIPAEVRNLLNLASKDKIIFRVENGTVRIEPVLMTLKEIAGSVMPLQPEKDLETQIREAKEEHYQARAARKGY